MGNEISIDGVEETPNGQHQLKCEDPEAFLASLGINELKAEKKKQLREDYEAAQRRTPKRRKISFEEPLETINEEVSFWSDDDADTAGSLESTPPSKAQFTVDFKAFKLPREDRHSERNTRASHKAMMMYLAPSKNTRSTT